MGQLIHLTRIEEFYLSTHVVCLPRNQKALFFKGIDTWSVILEPVAEGDNCEIQVNQAGQAEIVIQDILFGDVWVCSGQSNMEVGMPNIFNSTQEIEEIAAYKNIR